MQLRGALLAASLLALPIVASAQPVTGLYMGAGVGVNLMQDENVSSITGPGGTAFPSAKLGSRVGPAGVVSLGWGLGNGFRFEVEGDFRANKFNSLNSSGTSVAAAGGWEQKYGAMVNAVYDFVGLPVVQPYVGLGVGYQWAFEKNVAAYGGGDSINLGTSTKGDFAYQAILGVALPIAAAPGLEITAEYRFMGMAGNRNDFRTATAGGITAPVSVKLNDDYNHTFLVGFRYNFGQVPPPAPAPIAAPAPAVQPARS